MRVPSAIILLHLAGIASCLNFRKTAPGKTVSEDVSPPSDFDFGFSPSELLEFPSRKPVVYIKALLELRRLEQEPICHRTAAQLLMNNCRGIEENDASDNQWDTAHLQRHHIESFAIGLTMCDAERTKWDIPEACTPFESAALYRAARDKHSRLDITHQQVEHCMEALGRDQSQWWTTFINAREKAVTMCRAARLDIEKDQAIKVQRYLVELMGHFMEDLENDLHKLKENVAESSRQASSFVENIVTQAEEGKAKLEIVFESIVDEIKDVNTAVKSVQETANDVTRMYKLALQNAIHDTAEFAAEQAAAQEQAVAVKEKALELATSSFQQRVGDINVVIVDAESSVLTMQAALDRLIPMVEALHDRQEGLEERAEAALSAMINATEILQSHNQNLHQASIKASDINSNLDQASQKAALASQTWQERLSMRSGFPDWAVRVLLPTGSVVLGSFGVPHSLAGNLMLLAGGSLVGEAIVQTRYFFISMILPSFGKETSSNISSIPADINIPRYPFLPHHNDMI